MRDAVPTADDPGSVIIFRLGWAGIVSLLPMFFLVFMRLGSRDAARDLQIARDQLAAARQEQRQLLVERAMLRDPARLRALALAMGLASPKEVVHLGPAPRDPATLSAEGDVP
jgi:hypothetical protein